MKYSQQIGVILCLILVATSYMPWALYPSLQLTANGMNSAQLGYGRPGLLLMIFSGIDLLLFLLPFVTAKRINLFIASINFAWAIRNFSLYSECSAGECPVRKYGLYLMMIIAVGIFLMSMLPTTKIKRKDAFKQ